MVYNTLVIHTKERLIMAKRRRKKKANPLLPLVVLLLVAIVVLVILLVSMGNDPAPDTGADVSTTTSSATTNL